MKLFSFDNYWGLDWQKQKDGFYHCYLREFIYVADATRSHAPVFAIYKDAITEDTCLAARLDSDSFIMQLKSIKETGKIVKK